MSKYQLDLNDDYYSNESRLSVRSRNIMMRLGGVDAMLIYFKKHGSFENVPQAGVHTNVQLSSFCNYLINNNLIQKERYFPEEQIKPSYEFISKLKYAALINRYLVLKINLSVRAKNVLNQLELDHKYNSSDELSAKYIKTILLEEYSYSSIRNIGEKTKNEFEVLKSEILKILDSLPLDDEALILIDLKTKILRLLDNKIDIDEVEDIIEYNQYSFKKLISIYLLNLDLRRRQREVLLHQFFREEHTGVSDIAKEVSCTNERIRQIVEGFEKIIIPEAISSMLNYLKDIPSELVLFGDMNIVICNNLPSVIYKKTKYSPNNYFTVYVYSIILKKNFLSLNEAVFNSNKTRKSFLSITETIFISKIFIKNSYFFDFIDWIDNEIYSFETIEFEYELEVLVERFYKESDIIISKEILNELIQIIGKIKKTNWSDINELITRNRTRRNYEDAINLSYDFIKLYEKPQKTASIITHLQSHLIDLPTYKILTLLNNNKSKFKQLGNGYWSLRELESSENVEGSLRNIIFK